MPPETPQGMSRPPSMAPTPQPYSMVPATNTKYIKESQEKLEEPKGCCGGFWVQLGDELVITGIPFAFDPYYSIQKY